MSWNLSFWDIRLQFAQWYFISVFSSLFSLCYNANCNNFNVDLDHLVSAYCLVLYTSTQIRYCFIVVDERAAAHRSERNIKNVSFSLFFFNFPEEKRMRSQWFWCKTIKKCINDVFIRKTSRQLAGLCLLFVGIFSANRYKSTKNKIQFMAFFFILFTFQIY